MLLVWAGPSQEDDRWFWDKVSLLVEPTRQVLTPTISVVHVVFTQPEPWALVSANFPPGTHTTLVTTTSQPVLEQRTAELKVSPGTIQSPHCKAYCLAAIAGGTSGCDLGTWWWLCSRSRQTFRMDLSKNADIMSKVDY